MTTTNDIQFKAVLQKLTLPQQRQVAARFVENAMSLSGDPRVKAAVSFARRADISDAELIVVQNAAKSAAVETYTHCGDEGDWLGQAGHFLAEAALASGAPPEKASSQARDVAMRVRVARTCETIAKGHGTEHSEAEVQYRLLDEFQRQ